MTISTQVPDSVRGLYRILETRERAKLAQDMSGLSDLALSTLARRGGGLTQELAKAELERRYPPPCPICSLPMRRTELGDWLCTAEHAEPSLASNEEVCA